MLQKRLFFETFALPLENYAILCCFRPFGPLLDPISGPFWHRNLSKCEGAPSHPRHRVFWKCEALTPPTSGFFRLEKAQMLKTFVSFILRGGYSWMCISFTVAYPGGWLRGSAPPHSDFVPLGRPIGVQNSEKPPKIGSFVRNLPEFWSKISPNFEASSQWLPCIVWGQWCKWRKLSGKFRKLSESFGKFPEQSSRNFPKVSDDIWSVESFGNFPKVSIFFTKKFGMKWQKILEIFWKLWVVTFIFWSQDWQILKTSENSKFLICTTVLNNDQKNFSRYFGTFYIIWKVSESFGKFPHFFNLSEILHRKILSESFRNFRKVSESFRPFQSFREFYMYIFYQSSIYFFPVQPPEWSIQIAFGRGVQAGLWCRKCVVVWPGLAVAVKNTRPGYTVSGTCHETWLSIEKKLSFDSIFYQFEKNGWIPLLFTIHSVAARISVIHWLVPHISTTLPPPLPQKWTNTQIGVFQKCIGRWAGAYGLGQTRLGCD